MAGSRKLLTAGAVGVAALALIGAGATASFTDAVSVQQGITSGTMAMRLSGPPGSSLSEDGRILTLRTLTNQRSTFSTGSQSVTLTNSGSLEATGVTLTVTAPSTNKHLTSQLGVKIVVSDATGRSRLAYDGLLTGLVGADATPIKGVKVGPDSSMSASIEFYAGFADVPSLTNAAQGGTVTPTLTVGFKE